MTIFNNIHKYISNDMFMKKMLLFLILLILTYLVYNKYKSTLILQEGVVNDNPEGVVNDNPEGVVNDNPEGVVNDNPEGVVNDNPEVCSEKWGENIIAKCDSDFSKENSFYWGLNRNVCKLEISNKCDNPGNNKDKETKTILNATGNEKFNILINNLGNIIPNLGEKICQNTCLKCDDRTSDNIIYWRQIAYITVINANIWNNMVYDGGNWMKQSGTDEKWYITLTNGEFQQTQLIEGFREGNRLAAQQQQKMNLAKAKAAANQ